MGGKSKKVTFGYKYYAGAHHVLCHGPVDAIRYIDIDDRRARDGAMTDGDYTINAPELFGSTEGGVSGPITVYNGVESQVPDGYLLSQTGEYTPAYKKVLSVVLKKLYLGNNPYIKRWAYNVKRILSNENGINAQWYPSKAEIPVGITDNSIIVPNSISVNLLSLTHWSGDIYPAQVVTRDVAPVENNVPNMIEDVSNFYFGGASSSLSSQVMSLEVQCSFAGIVDVEMEAICGTSSNPEGVVEFSASKFSDIRKLTIIDDGYLRNTSNTFNVAKKFKIHANVRVNQGDVLTLNATAYNDNGPNDLFEFSITAKLVSISYPYVDGPVDMNPAHILRELLTSRSYGLGYNEDDIDEASFIYAADRLFTDKLGISYVWEATQPVEDFIKFICEHINAALYLNRSTGKFTLKLIRDDYDINTTLHLTPDNCISLSDFSRVQFNDLVNTVTLTYDSHELNGKASVTVSDIAMVAAHGMPIVSNIEFMGLSNARSASLVAQRELKSLSSPTITCTIIATDIAKDLKIGDVFRVSWPDYSINAVPMRAVSIAYGDGKNNRIKIVAAQDVFFSPEVLMTGDTPPDGQYVAPLPKKITNQMAFEAPYLELVQQFGQANIDSILSTNGDIGYIGYAAGVPDGNAAINAKMYVDNGSGFEGDGIVDFCEVATLTSDLTRLGTTLSVDTLPDIDLAPVGYLFSLNDEIMEVISYNAGNTMTVKRAQCDTVPVPHTSGSKLYFWDIPVASDEVQYISGEVVSVKAAARTSAGEFDINLADVIDVEFESRAIRPYPPGNVKVNGEFWPENEIAGNITLSWAHRDRKQQTASSGVDFSAGNIGPENGTTYRVIIESNGAQIDNITTAGTSLVIDPASYGLSGGYIIDEHFNDSIVMPMDALPPVNTGGVSLASIAPHAGLEVNTVNKLFNSNSIKMQPNANTNGLLLTQSSAYLFNLFQKSVTIEAWVYFPVAHSNITDIFITDTLHFNLSISSGNVPTVSVWNAAANGVSTLTALADMHLAQFVHLAMTSTYRPATNNYIYRLYQDGVEVGNFTDNRPESQIFNGALRVFRSASSFSSANRVSMAGIRYSLVNRYESHGFALPADRFKESMFDQSAAPGGELALTLSSERDGYSSYQEHVIPVALPAPSGGGGDEFEQYVVSKQYFNTDPTFRSAYIDKTLNINMIPKYPNDAILIADSEFEKFTGHKTLKVRGINWLISGPHPYVSIQQDFTIEFWVRKNGAHSKIEYIASSMLTTSNHNNAWIIEMSATGLITFLWFNINGTVGPFLQGQAVPVNTWQHIAVSVQGNAVRLFQDGVLRASNLSATNKPSATTAMRLAIGNDPRSTGRWLNGNIADFRITHAARYTANFTPPGKLS